jgi:hypothetical protein
MSCQPKKYVRYEYMTYVSLSIFPVLKITAGAGSITNFNADRTKQNEIE